jgi:hypothetical protein
VEESLGEACIHSCALAGPYMQQADQDASDEAPSEGSLGEGPSSQGRTDVPAPCAGIFADVQLEPEEAG